MTAGSDHSSHPIVSSIGDFVRSGLRPRTPLAKAIVFVLVLKLIAVASMQIVLLFGAPPPDVNAQTINRVFAPATR